MTAKIITLPRNFDTRHISEMQILHLLLWTLVSGSQGQQGNNITTNTIVIDSNTKIHHYD